MLILTRKIGQQVLINQGAIQVKILSIDENKNIKIGFEAPGNVEIDREEVFFKKILQRNNVEEKKYA